jgi:hypothetical protein
MSRGAQKRNKNHEDFAYKPGAQYVLRSIVPKTQDENSEGIARDIKLKRIRFLNSDGSWRTKHPRWDQELFSFLYNENSRTLVEQRKQDLTDSIIALYLMNEEEITYSALGTLYSMAAQNFLPIGVVESVFQQSISQIPSYLTDEKRVFSTHLI